MVMLSPCPFCGSKAAYSRIPTAGFSVLCSGCGAIAMLDGSGERDRLGTAWNRRTIRPNFSRPAGPAPCPFCASSLSLGTYNQDSSILKCTSCGMIVSFATAPDLPTMLRYWNRRTPT